MILSFARARDENERFYDFSLVSSKSFHGYCGKFMAIESGEPRRILVSLTTTSSFLVYFVYQGISRWLKGTNANSYNAAIISRILADIRSVLEIIYRP